MYKVFVFLGVFFLFPAKGENTFTSQVTDSFLSQHQTTSAPSSQNGKTKEQEKPVKKPLKYNGKKLKEKRIYHLTVAYKIVNFTGTDRQAMAINDSLPAPTLYFQEGEVAVIHVTNKMDVKTSVHWHGILLPNFQDGIPYLTTPPIKPGKTHTFTFPLKHSGTYWYHSHTGLQEQRGIYGAIVIEPKKRKWNYDHNLTLVLSDWTDESPKEVLRTLKRGSEWYSIKKQTTQSLYKVIQHGVLGAQFQLWKQRMPGMDISDVYYPAFLINGKQVQKYPHFKGGEKIRLRVINAGASTYFWLSFGKKVNLISADGLNVEPVPTDKILHAIGETYDFLLTLPKGKAMEFRATAQDGSGTATALIGMGDPIKAPLPSQPDLMEQMKSMAASHSSQEHGHHSGHTKNKDNQSMHNLNRAGQERHPKSDKPTHHQNFINQKKSAHHQEGGHKSNPSEHHQDHTNYKEQREPHQSPINQKANHKNKTHHKPIEHQAFLSGYDHLKALKKTKFSKALPVRTIHLNLTGNMRRYVWSMNGKVLSESDKIKINENEVVRLILHNTTMMHHPMHLHGHFFRVLNKQGNYSPLKHTVDVPPMEIVTLEFEPNEKGDWFFHCHVLYHMKGGMARVFSRGDIRDSRLKDYPLSSIWNIDRQWYLLGELTLMTNRFDWHTEVSNTRNRLYFTKTISWFDHSYKPHKNYEMEVGYEYFFTDFFRVYGGMEAQNSKEGHLGLISNADLTGKAGIRYLLPYLIELDMSLDHKMRLEIELEYELLLLSQLELFADLEWTEYFAKEDRKNKKRKQEWSLGLNYIMSKSFSFRGSYDKHFGWGLGINWKL